MQIVYDFLEIFGVPARNIFMNKVVKDYTVFSRASFLNVANRYDLINLEGNIVIIIVTNFNLRSIERIRFGIVKVGFYISHSWVLLKVYGVLVSHLLDAFDCYDDIITNESIRVWKTVISDYSGNMQRTALLIKDIFGAQESGCHQRPDC